MTDQELAISAVREAQLILARYVHPGSRDSKQVINDLLSVLDRDDVVEAVDRLEEQLGLREDALPKFR